MTWQQTIDEEKEISFEEGRAEGVQANAIENARNLLRMNLLTEEQISQAVSLPLEQEIALKDELKVEN